MPENIFTKCLNEDEINTFLDVFISFKIELFLLFYLISCGLLLIPLQDRTRSVLQQGWYLPLQSTLSLQILVQLPLFPCIFPPVELIFLCHPNFFHDASWKRVHDSMQSMFRKDQLFFNTLPKCISSAALLSGVPLIPAAIWCLAPKLSLLAWTSDTRLQQKKKRGTNLLCLSCYFTMAEGEGRR